MCLAVPGRILEIVDDDAWTRRGKVDFGGIQKEIHLALVPEASPGQYVLVHVGVAISVLDEQEAARVFEYLDQIGELADELGPDARGIGPGTGGIGPGARGFGEESS